MDFYAPNVKWIKKQKTIEKKLFDELVENAIKECSWEYKLNYVENLLKYNHINEWEYFKKMDALKKNFEISNDDSDDEIEVDQIDETDTHILVREDETNNYYVVAKDSLDGNPIDMYEHDTPVQAILWFRSRVY